MLTQPSGLLAVVALCAACGAESPVDTNVAALQCGPTLDFTPVQQYRGSVASVQEREGAVALINGSCTGTLIAAAAGPVVLTAGHCVSSGDRVVVAFNVEAKPDGDPLVTEGTVIERETEPDYALIRLDTLPDAAPTPLSSSPTDLLAVIQHPRGRPKVVAEGALAGVCGRRLYYSNLDTLVGSSGAGVLNRQGHLVAVHSDGNCATDGTGTNHGWTAAAIVQASAHLQDDDLGG